MLYGHRHINNKDYANWISQWHADTYIEHLKKIMGDEIGNLEDKVINPIDSIKNLVTLFDGRDIDVFDATFGILNPAILGAYFRSSPISISVANYHEILVEPSDMVTKKELIKGYSYTTTGGIDVVSSDGEVVGHIGRMSDLFWHCFNEYYIVETPDGAIEHARNNDDDLTIQLWNIPDDSEFDEFVEQVLYECKVHLGLGFRRGFLYKEQTDEGDAKEFVLPLSGKKHELVPIRFFNSAIQTAVPRSQYLSYYQAIEYFYTRANNRLFQQNLLHANIDSLVSVDFGMVREALSTYQSLNRELEALKYVLTKAVDPLAIKSWISEENSRLSWFTNKTASHPELPSIDFTSEKSVISTLSRRVYSIRCSLVHSKGETKEFVFIPRIHDELLLQEVPLIRLLAQMVLDYWSEAQLV